MSRAYVRSTPDTDPEYMTSEEERNAELDAREKTIEDLETALEKIADIAGDYGDGAPDSHYLAVRHARIGSHCQGRPRRGAWHAPQGSGSHAEEATAVRTSETINELAAALATAQGEMQNAAMSAENPHFKSRYADLAAIRNATIPALSKNGLSILQAMSTNSTEMLLTTRLMHSSGQWIESAYPILFNERPHVMGSAITYAKRYSWSAITGIAAEVDDDGNEAQDAAKNGNALPSLPKRKSSAAGQARRRLASLRAGPCRHPVGERSGPTAQ